MAYADTKDRDSLLTTQDTLRFQALTKEVRCLVCQNQTIADSNAPLARDLREKIYHMVLDQKSNEEIKNYLTQRYGEFILLRPRFSAQTALLWLFPFVGIFAIVLFLSRFMAVR